MTAPAQLTCEYKTLVNRVALTTFGLRPTSVDVITDGVAGTSQATDILNAISDGLSYVYNAWTWSFLTPVVPINTTAPYTTGTVTVSAGTATGSGTTFPSTPTTGLLYIPTVGAFPSTYVSGTSLTLANATGVTVSSGLPFYLMYNSYALSTVSGATIDSFLGELTFAQGLNFPVLSIPKVDELEIRRMLARESLPGMPRAYALTSNIFDPTAGSTRYVTFFPNPDRAYVLTGKASLRPTMVDATNKYPLGVEVLSAVLMESVLAAAERNIQEKDAQAADAVHNRALAPLLMMAIKRDQEYSGQQMTADQIAQQQQMEMLQQQQQQRRPSRNQANQPDWQAQG